METTVPTDVYYGPHDVAIVHDPYPVYARLVEEAPFHYNERYDFWALSRYADSDEGAVELGDVLQQSK